MYKIYSDIAGDFFKSDLSRAEIIPMEFIIDEKIYTHTLDYKEMSRDEFLKLLKTSEMSTTMVNQFKFEETFRKTLEEGMDILYLAFSSGLSGQYLQAVNAKEVLEEEFPDRKIEVVDSKNATWGMGIILHRGFENMDSGMSLHENAEDLRNFADNVASVFIVEDLNHLKRGGRISSIDAFLGTAIKIKPILRMSEEGKLVPYEKARGINSAYKKIVDIYFKNRDKSSNKIVIYHCDNLEGSTQLKELFLKKDNTLQIEIEDLNPIICVHTGLGLISMSYEGVKS